MMVQSWYHQKDQLLYYFVLYHLVLYYIILCYFIVYNFVFYYLVILSMIFPCCSLKLCFNALSCCIRMYCSSPISKTSPFLSYRVWHKWSISSIVFVVPFLLACLIAYVLLSVTEYTNGQSSWVLLVLGVFCPYIRANEVLGIVTISEPVLHD